MLSWKPGDVLRIPCVKNQDVGSIVRRLRRIVGLSVAQCAARLSLDPEAVTQLEEGELDVVALEGVASMFGLDVDDLANGEIHPSADVERATVFLLHGAHQQFDAADLGVMFDALAEARAFIASATDTGLAGARRRVALTPVPVAGPNPADAAKQGYKLARLVRTTIGEERGCLHDLGAIASDTFGVLVLEAELSSPRLRAAAVVDARRLAAAAVLGSNDIDGRKNDALSRVYLAHELCHILFDPAPPGTVRLALDEEQRGGVGRAGRDALYESRAKGFAAELLMPLAGLTELCGPACCEADDALVRALLVKVREHFGVPREISVNHLVNHAFIHRALRLQLLDPALVWPPLRSVPTTTRRLSEERPGSSAAEDAASLATAEQNATRLRASARRELASRAADANGAARVIEATDLLARWADEQLLASQFDEVAALMNDLDVTNYDPRVLTGLLTITSAARVELGESRSSFVVRVLNHLGAVGWAEDRVARVRDRLA